MVAKSKKRNKTPKAAVRAFTSESKGLVQPSTALAAIIGNEPLPRTEVTKRVWDYIKINDLQDPSDKRRIKADPKLRVVFGNQDNVGMFELSRHVNRHLETSLHRVTGLPGEIIVKPRRVREEIHYHLGGDTIVKP